MALKTTWVRNGWDIVTGTDSGEKQILCFDVLLDNINRFIVWSINLSHLRGCLDVE
jgi:hypothetical protein